MNHKAIFWTVLTGVIAGVLANYVWEKVKKDCKCA